MTPSDYIKSALRTDLPDYGDMIKRLQNPQVARLLHGAMGLVTESAEIMDALKKHIMYGKTLDLVNIKEEIGDQAWYLAILLDELNSSFEEVMDVNIKKLTLRYPAKFTEESAIVRDLGAERKLLEDGFKNETSEEKKEAYIAMLIDSDISEESKNKFLASALSERSKK